MTKIGVFGAGLIGCYVGGRLAMAGAEVVLLARERIRADIAANGLSLSDFTGWRGHVSADELIVSTDPDSLSDAEIVLVCVKSADTEEAGRKLAQIARPDALIVSLQNGVSNARRLSEHAPDLSVFAGMVPFNVARLEDGAFHQGTVGGLYFEDDARLRAALAFNAVDAVMWGRPGWRRRSARRYGCGDVGQIVDESQQCDQCFVRPAAQGAARPPPASARLTGENGNVWRCACARRWICCNFFNSHNCKSVRKGA